ncbi:phosphatase PAP2 family protein [Corynebacterium halotolerans]|uniref:phosphatase PAP2 family protein n=1 Tax=Corynebacterium halotolerans TaxID=225326 RepID=UPI003CF0DC46
MNRRIAVAVLLWVTAIALVLGLSAGPAWSVALYRLVAVEPLLGWGAWLSEAAVLALVALYGAAGLWALWGPHRRDWVLLLRLFAGGLAACLSYGLNLVLKGSFSAVRPCHLHEVVSVCPPADNWSFPSNHTVIACSLMIGLVVARPRLAWVAVPLAVLAACARVASGDHYPHDVLAGAAVGTLFYLGAAAVALPVLDHGARRLRGAAEKYRS